jgi:hypothetical protein
MDPPRPSSLSHAGEEWFLDGSMTANDLIFVLQQLTFANDDAVRAVKIDRPVRDYLISTLRRR